VDEINLEKQPEETAGSTAAEAQTQEKLPTKRQRRK